MAKRYGGVTVDLVGHLKASISACQAVHMGIATHAEKEQCKRDTEQNKRQQNQRLMKSGKTGATGLRAYSPVV
jgi:hypothetical protein